MTDFRPEFIEIDTGVQKIAGVTAGRIFWIDVVEVDGGRLGIWLGGSYATAIEVAERARLDWELSAPVRDLVGGAQ